MFEKRNYILPLATILMLAVLLGPQLLATAAPAPEAAIAPVEVAQASGKTFIDWLVVKHITVQSGGIDMSSALDMQTNIISNIGNAGTDFDTSGGLTTAGESTFNGGIDLNAQTLKLDALGTTTMAAATKAIVLMTSSVATGTWAIRTGNLTVGNGSPGTTLNGEDAYIEGTLEVDDKVRLDGALDANSTANVAGTATLNALAVTTTSDLKGNVSDSGGTFTIADNTMIDGAADQIQLTVAGHTTQTSNLVVFETSAGTDLFYLTGAGVLQQVGAATIGGLLTVNDATAIAGDGDEVQLTVTGHTTQTSNLVVFEAKGGADLFTLTGAGVGAITGAFTVGGKLTVNDAADISGDADEIQLTVSAHLTQTSNLVAFENYTGTDYLTVSGAGAVDVASASVTFGTDNLYALGYASDARAVVCGTTNITGTKTIASGADTYEYCTCSMGEAPDAGAGQGFISWCTISGGDLLVYAYTVTGTQSTETNVAINYCVVSDTQP